MFNIQIDVGVLIHSIGHVLCPRYPEGKEGDSLWLQDTFVAPKLLVIFQYIVMPSAVECVQIS